MNWGWSWCKIKHSVSQEPFGTSQQERLKHETLLEITMMGRVDGTFALVNCPRWNTKEQRPMEVDPFDKSKSENPGSQVVKNRLSHNDIHNLSIVLTFQMLKYSCPVRNFNFNLFFLTSKCHPVLILWNCKTNYVRFLPLRFRCKTIIIAVAYANPDWSVLFQLIRIANLNLLV